MLIDEINFSLLTLFSLLHYIFVGELKGACQMQTDRSTDKQTNKQTIS